MAYAPAGRANINVWENGGQVREEEREPMLPRAGGKKGVKGVKETWKTGGFTHTKK